MEDKPGLSREVLDHVRKHDYDGQGKSQAQEARDSMFIVAYAVLGAGIVLGVIVGILIIQRIS